MQLQYVRAPDTHGLFSRSGIAWHTQLFHVILYYLLIFSLIRLLNSVLQPQHLFPPFASTQPTIPGLTIQ